MLRRFLKQNAFAIVMGAATFVSGLLIRILFPSFFSPEQYGLLATAMSLMFYFATVSDAGVFNGMTKFFGEAYHKKSPHAFKLGAYLGLIRFALLSIVALYIWLNSEQLASSVFHSAQYAGLFRIISISSFLYGMTMLFCNYFSAANEFFYNMILGIVLNGAKAILPILFLFFICKDIECVLSSFIFAFLISFLFILALFIYFFISQKHIEMNWNVRIPKVETNVIIKFLVLSAVLSVSSYFFGAPEIALLSYFRNAEEAAYYSLAVTIIFAVFSLLPISVDFLFSSLVELEAKKETERQKKMFEKTAKYAGMLTIAISLFIFFFSSKFFDVLIRIMHYDSNYINAAFALQILAPVVFFSFFVSVAQKVFIARGRMESLVINMILVFLFSISGNVLLASTFGFRGTAFAALATQSFAFLLLFPNAAKEINAEIKLLYFIKPLLFFVPSLVLLIALPHASAYLLLPLSLALYSLMFLVFLEEEDKRLILRFFSFVLGLGILPKYFQKTGLEIMRKREGK